jgi:hypothetical protein
MKRNVIAVIAASLAFGAITANAEPTLNFNEGYWKQPDTVVQVAFSDEAQSGKQLQAPRQDDSGYLYNVNP